jgi:hypothetical protein
MRFSQLRERVLLHPAQVLQLALATSLRFCATLTIFRHWRSLIRYSYQHFIRSNARTLQIRGNPIASIKSHLLSSAQEGIIVFRSLPQLLKRTISVTIAAAGFSFFNHSDSAVADFLSEPGGSNFVFISQHEYSRLPLGSAETGNCSAYAMGDARSVIAVYDVAKTAVDAKLRSLYAAGQRKISLVLWHFFNQYTYAPPQTTYLNAYCEMVFADGVLTNQHQTNLSALIATIKTIGFTQINFRFAPMDISDPMGWSSWDEAQFQSNWNLIWQTRQLIYQSLNSVPGANPRVLFDLGLELGGMWAIPAPYAPANPQIFQQYVNTLWLVYTYNYGVSDTIGFSIAPGFSGQISAQISAYDSTTGGRPNAYGFDLATRLLSQPVTILLLTPNSTSYHQSLARQASFQRNFSSRKLTPTPCSPATRFHRRAKKEFHFGICSSGRIALVTRLTSSMFMT